LESDVEKRLARVAARMKTDPAELVNMAVDYFLDQVETPEEELITLEEDRLDYERTGLHLTNEEVIEWLERRANGEDVPMPKPPT